MIKYFIVCPLIFLAGFIDAIAGGGGLISLPAYLLTGMPAINCLASNKFTATMGTTVAVGKYARDGMIPWKRGLFCIPFAFAGSTFGANLAMMMDDKVFKIVMMVLLPITAAYILKKKSFDVEGDEVSQGKMLILCGVISLAIGVYDGFYGPGTGTFLLLLFTGVARMQPAKANGLTKVINGATNWAAAIVYLINGKVIFPIAIITALCSVAGNYMGARAFSKGGMKIARPAIMVVISIFFVKVVTELL